MSKTYHLQVKQADNTIKSYKLITTDGIKDLIVNTDEINQEQNNQEDNEENES